MKTCLFVLAILATTAASAQQFSAGVRTGVGFWRGSAFDQEAYSTQPRRTTLWEKEVFVRYEPAGHFAYEAGITQFEAEAPKQNLYWCGVGLPATYPIGGSIRDKYYGLNLRMQYGFSCAKIKGLRHFAGIALTPTLHVAESADQMVQSGTGDQYVARTDAYEAGAGFAFEDMIRYQVSRHLDVHSIIACRGNLNSTLLAHGFTVQFGVAYRF